MSKLEIKQVDVGLLKEYDNNPRNNKKAVDAVAASIKEFGFKVPITVDADMVICTGHTRLKAAKKLGLKTVPVIILEDLGPEQIKAFRLADNKVGEIAEWDFEALAIELAGIKEIDMSQFEFDIPGIEPEIVEDDFEIKVPLEPKSKLGHMFISTRKSLNQKLLKI